MTAKQKEVIRLMREGWDLRRIKYTNIVCLQKDGEPKVKDVRYITVAKLRDNRTISTGADLGNFATYQLTEFGCTVKL